jgi:aspartyl-tRNA(Asn)/glutamyl-tRNA(Gln) amidotransferase subunit A
MKNPFFSSLLDYARGRDAKQFSIEEVTRYFLSGIEKLNPSLNAYLSINRNALNRARQLDNLMARNKAASPFFGYPLAVKDNMEIEGQSTTCASRILEGYRSERTATSILRLLEKGAIVLGKTNLDEFAMGSSTENSAFGPTRNPWNPSRVPGGSSGGSAAAVASGLAPLSLGSDTGGSIRQPAAFCGVLGVKPTYGRISRSGLVAFSSSLDQIGPFATTPADALESLVAMGGADKLDMTTARRDPEEMRRDYERISVKNLKVGISEPLFGEGLDSGIRKRLEEVREKLSREGNSEVPVDLSSSRHGINVYYLLATSEASSNLSRFDGVRYGFRVKNPADLRTMYEQTRDLGFGDEVKRRILLGTFALSAGYQDAFYRKARKVQSLIRRDFLTAFSRCDFILTPATPTPPFSFGEKTADPLSMYLSDVYTITANLAGLPAISVPVGVNSDGLPVGAHLIGPPWSEGLLLKIADWIVSRYPMTLPAIHATEGGTK